jgi:hypothetical protein
MLPVGSAVRTLLAVWPVRAGEDQGMNAIWPLGWVLLFLVHWAGTGWVLWMLWKRLVTIPKSVARGTASPPTDAPLLTTRLIEEPLPTGKGAHDFWQALYRTASWATLSHIYQADARNYLRDAKDAAAAGNQTGALFFLGKAHEAAFNAVKPEAQIQRAIRAMTEAAKFQQQDAANAVASGGGRPGDRWGRGD